jgi:hypothetical protein
MKLKNQRPGPKGAVEAVKKKYYYYNSKLSIDKTKDYDYYHIEI